MQADNSLIWRYMDTARFAAMLEDRALYFANAVSFTDPFEGSIPLRNVNARIAKITREFDSKEPLKEYFQEVVSDHGMNRLDIELFVTTQVQVQLEFRDKLMSEYPTRDEALKKWIARHNFEAGRFYWDRQNTFINCLHESEVESAAMWNLYSNNEHSVCIRSRISSLRACLSDDVAIDRVKYIDFSKDQIEGLNDDNQVSFLAHRYKRSSFSHEREVRALFGSFEHVVKRGDFVHGMPLMKLGVLKAVDLNMLVEEIFVAPSSPSWYLSLIQKLATRYGLNAPVKMSSMVADPLY